MDSQKKSALSATALLVGGKNGRLVGRKCDIAAIVAGKIRIDDDWR
jgi:hypothetical protein